MLYLYSSNSDFDLVVNFAPLILLLAMELARLTGGVGLESHRLGTPCASALKSSSLGEAECSKGLVHFSLYAWSTASLTEHRQHFSFYCRGCITGCELSRKDSRAAILKLCASQF